MNIFQMTGFLKESYFRSKDFELSTKFLNEIDKLEISFRGNLNLGKGLKNKSPF